MRGDGWFPWPVAGLGPSFVGEVYDTTSTAGALQEHAGGERRANVCAAKRCAARRTGRRSAPVRNSPAIVCPTTVVQWGLDGKGRERSVMCVCSVLVGLGWGDGLECANHGPLYIGKRQGRSGPASDLLMQGKAGLRQRVIDELLELACIRSCLLHLQLVVAIVVVIHSHDPPTTLKSWTKFSPTTLL